MTDADQAAKEKRFRNLAMVLANDATMGLYPMGAAWLVSGDDDYDVRLAEARGKVDQARSELSGFDENLALAGSIVAPLGMGAAGRVAREMAPASKAAWTAGQATRPVVIGGAGAVGSYDPRLSPEEQRRQAVLGGLGAFLPAHAGAKFPEAMDWARFAYDSLPAARPKSPRPRIEPSLPIPATPPNHGAPGSGLPSARRSPQRTAEQPTSATERGRLADRVKRAQPESPDPKALLDDMERLQKQLEDMSDLLPQVKYSRNREHLTGNPNSLQTRLQQGPKPYAGKKPPDRQQMEDIKMAQREFHAAMEPLVRKFREGRIRPDELAAHARFAALKAGDGNNVDPQYLAKQIKKLQAKDPYGWSSLYPEKD